MHPPRAAILVFGDCCEAQFARRILGRLGASLIQETEFHSRPALAFGLFFTEGSFTRPGVAGSRRASGLIRIRATAEELQAVGVAAVPACLAGARGFIVCRTLTDAQLCDPAERERFENALREAERVCTRTFRAALQNAPARSRADSLHAPRSMGYRALCA